MDIEEKKNFLAVLIENVLWKRIHPDQQEFTYKKEVVEKMIQSFEENSVPDYLKFEGFHDFVMAYLSQLEEEITMVDKKESEKIKSDDEFER